MTVRGWSRSARPSGRMAGMKWFKPMRPSKDWIPPRDVKSKAPKWSLAWWRDQLRDLVELVTYFLPT